MAQLHAGDIYLAKAVCFEDTDKQLGLNIYHFAFGTATGAPVDAQLFADQLSTALAAQYKPMLADAAEFLGVEVQRIKPTLDVAFTSNLGAGFGTANVSMMPTVAAPVVSFKTALPKQGGRGRAFMPFNGSDATNATGQLNTTGKGRIDNVMGALTGFLAVTDPLTLGTIACGLVLYKRSTGAANAVLRYEITGKVGRQKRRGDYGRLNPRPIL
jgi:hypothetical protein